MAKTFKAKRQNAIEIRTYKGKKDTYLVLTDGKGVFHVFAEVEAKEAAIDCGAPPHTKDMWKNLWATRQV